MSQETPIVQEFKQSRSSGSAPASDAPASVTAGPGARLRLARLEMDNVSIEDIAAHLRLSPQVILDIENDEYANTLFTFTRGYLRGYAKLMGLPEEEIIQSFNELHLTESPRPYLPFDDTSKKPLKVKDSSSRSHHKAMRWISASVILLLLVLVGFWWESQSATLIPTQHNGPAHSSKLLPLLSSLSPTPTVPVNPTNLAQNNAALLNTSDTQTLGKASETFSAPASSVPSANQTGTSVEPVISPTASDAAITSTNHPAVLTVPAAQVPVGGATSPSSVPTVTDSKADTTPTDQTQSAPVEKTHHVAKKHKSTSSSQPMNTIVPVPYSADDE